MTQINAGNILVTLPPQPAKPKLSWAAVGMLALSGLGALGSFGLAASLVGAGLFSQFNQNGLPIQSTETLFLALTSALTGVLLVPPMALAFLRILGKPLPAWSGRVSKAFETAGLFGLLAWLVVLVAGQWMAGRSDVTWLVMPPLQLLAGSLPVAWLVLVGKRGLSSGSPLRTWSILTIELSVTFVVIVIAELLVFAGLIAVWLVFLAANPGIRAELNQLVLRLMNIQQVDSETMQRILQPYLARPVVAYTGLAIIAGIVPLIEELLKPLAVWLLAHRLTTPAQGFVAGLISGGGFALLESLGRMGSAPSDGWAGVAIGRAGTDLLHVLTAGLMGWALVSAWRERKYLQLGLTYFLCVLTHGLWNGLALWMGFSTLIPISPGELPFSQRLGIVSPVGLVILAVVMFIVLLRANRIMRVSDHTTS